MNDWRKRFVGEKASPRVRSAFSSPASSCRRIAASSVAVAPPAARVRRAANADSSSAASPGSLPAPSFHLLECHVGVEGVGARRRVASPGQGVGRVQLSRT